MLEDILRPAKKPAKPIRPYPSYYHAFVGLATAAGAIVVAAGSWALVELLIRSRTVTIAIVAVLVSSAAASWAVGASFDRRRP